MIGFDKVWQNVRNLEGETFMLTRGSTFTYEMLHAEALKVVKKGRVGQTITYNLLRKAYARLPFDDTAALQDLWVPSYLFAILKDKRVMPRE